MAAELVHQTDKHDWYKMRFRKEGWSNVHSVIYNIIPKDNPIPVSGYYSPRYIMDMKGYEDLKVGQTFEKCTKQ